MAAPSRAAASTDALERLMRGFSIHDSGGRSGGRRCYNGGMSRCRGSEKAQTTASEQDEITLDLNSETALPPNWEQCLDLKTGELYFINRSNGVKTKEDPRDLAKYRGQYYYSEDDEDDDESSEFETDEEEEEEEEEAGTSRSTAVKVGGEQNVLVVAGCRCCLMYYMVSKQVNECPKCDRKLLHFDRLENATPAV